TRTIFKFTYPPFIFFVFFYSDVPPGPRILGWRRLSKAPFFRNNEKLHNEEQGHALTKREPLHESREYGQEQCRRNAILDKVRI
ncbi:MAG: hypothetical protein LUD07_07165, partial [Clostridiales bacterium]|nr:hypothetical protein [Clostridiales bacterium]